MFDNSSSCGPTPAQPTVISENPQFTALTAEQRAYWHALLADAPALLELPTDRPRPAVLGDRTDAIALAVDARLTDSLKALAQRHGTSLGMIILAGWAVVVARLSSQPDVLLGLCEHSRADARVLRLNLASDLDTQHILEQVRLGVRDAQEHQRRSFEDLPVLLDVTPSLAFHSIVQVMFAWSVDQPQPLSAPRSVGFDLTLALSETQGQISGRNRAVRGIDCGAFRRLPAPDS